MRKRVFDSVLADNGAHFLGSPNVERRRNRRPEAGVTELFDLADMEWRNGLAGARVVYSSLAIHHLDGPGKRRLFKDVYRMLEKGGVSSWRI